MPTNELEYEECEHTQWPEYEQWQTMATNELEYEECEQTQQPEYTERVPGQGRRRARTRGGKGVSHQSRIMSRMSRLMRKAHHNG